MALVYRHLEWDLDSTRVLAMAHGADFQLSFVPPDYELSTGSLNFDPVEGTGLFELGYQQALDGMAWATQRAPSSDEELLKLIVDPASAFDGHEQPAWLTRGEQYLERIPEAR